MILDRKSILAIDDEFDMLQLSSIHYEDMVSMSRLSQNHYQH
jgi:hypothetical protein